MTVETLPQEPATATADHHLVHTVCSLEDPDRALCGKDMTGQDWAPWADYPDDCVVCETLALTHAESCDGEQP